MTLEEKKAKELWQIGMLKMHNNPDICSTDKWNDMEEKQKLAWLAIGEHVIKAQQNSLPD